MNPISPETARSILKLARELCLIRDGDRMALALQQYFEIQGQPSVSDFFKRLKKLPFEVRTRVAESLSFGQIDSKLWMMRELKGFESPEGVSVFVLGGWYGILSLLMLWCSPVGAYRLRSIDIDPETTALAASLVKWYELNQDMAFLAATADMYELDYVATRFAPHGYGSSLSESPGLIINTSCEHLREFDRWWERIPNGSRVVLQSNNFFSCAEHVGCVASLEELQAKAPLSKLHYAGQLPLDNYDRFMLIGVK